MRRHVLLLALLATGAFVAGCLLLPANIRIPRPVAEALEAPDSLLLYSLEPTPIEPDGNKGKPPAETFHGHTILGQVDVKDAVTRRRLVGAFNRGVSDHDGSVAACFIPHHGMRIQKGRHTVDLIICFKCAQVYVYVDNEKTESFLISTLPRSVFNEVLERARVPLSAGAK